MSIAFKSRRKLNKRGSKASNAGFSLVELLIAVVILAIIVIPLLRMFVTSTRINVKSRQMLRATTVAQDIMEGLKAYTLEEVRTQFAPPEGTSGNSYFFPTEGFYVVNTSMIQGGVREITELEIDDPDDPDSEIYYFGIENLKMQGGEYDALIKLDASTYTEAKVDGVGGSGPTADAHDNAFNGAFYAEIGSVAETAGEGSATDSRDSSYHEHKELNKGVLADIKKQVEDDYALADKELPANWDDLQLEDILKGRDIEVVFEDAGNSECKATITFTYTCEIDGIPYTSHGSDGSAAGKANGITRTFSSGNFYLFYYPCYASARIDNITFAFKDSAKLFDADNPMLKSITLAKQIRSDVLVSEGVIVPELTDSQLFSKESTYMALVHMQMDVSGASMDNNLIFRTNIDTNMAEMAKHTDPVTGEIERDDVLGISAVFDGVLNSKVQQIGLTGTNVSDKVTNVIYDIEITVYETGAAEHFGETNFENNHEVHRLAQITNLDR